MDCNIQQTREVQEEQSFFKVAGEKKMWRKFLIRDGQDGRLIVHQLTRRFVRSTSFFWRGQAVGHIHCKSVSVTTFNDCPNS